MFDGVILLIQILRGALLRLMGRREMYSYEFFFFYKNTSVKYLSFFFFFRSLNYSYLAMYEK